MPNHDALINNKLLLLSHKWNEVKLDTQTFSWRRRPFQLLDHLGVQLYCPCILREDGHSSPEVSLQCPWPRLWSVVELLRHLRGGCRLLSLLLDISRGEGRAKVLDRVQLFACWTCWVPCEYRYVCFDLIWPCLVCCCRLDGVHEATPAFCVWYFPKTAPACGWCVFTIEWWLYCTWYITNLKSLTAGSKAGFSPEEIDPLSEHNEELVNC